MPEQTTRQNDPVRLHQPVTLLAAPQPRPLSAGEPEREKTRRQCEILAYSGAPIIHLWGDFVMDIQGMSMKDSIPILLQHNEESIVGQSHHWLADTDGLHIFGTLSDATDEARKVAALADEGFPWQASVGVCPLEILSLGKGQTRTVNGREITGPMDVWTKSLVGEISFVTNGADSNTAATVLAGPSSTLKGGNMDDEKKNEQVPGTVRSAAPAAPTTQMTLAAPQPVLLAPPAPAMDPVKTDPVKTDPVKLERERAAGIMTLCSKVNLGVELAQQWIADGVNLDKARELAIEKMTEAPGGRPVQRLETGAAFGLMAESDKFRALAAQGIAANLGWRTEKLESGADQFRQLGLADMARMTLERAGVQTLSMGRREVARQLFSPYLRLSASVSDFSAVFMNVADKLLLQGYEEAGRTFEPWTSRRAANDFRDMHGISLSEAPELLPVGENEEYKSGSLSDNVEKFRIAKFGRKLSISWEMVVNDDLSAFSRIPAMFGAATARKYSDIVYELLTAGNAKMSDGKPLFHADHRNLVPATGITDAGMNAARMKIRMQTGMGGTRLNLSPAFLLVPPSLENTANVLLRSAALPQADMSAGVYNPWGDSRITPIVEQRLEPLTGEKPWYLVASPTQVPTIEVAYLYGNDSPEVTEIMDQNVDAITYKVRACMGAGIVDYRGFVKNPGVNR